MKTNGGVRGPNPNGQTMGIGIITEKLPNGLFRVHLDNGLDIEAFISDKIQHQFSREELLLGVRVKVGFFPERNCVGRIFYIFPTN